MNRFARSNDRHDPSESAPAVPDWGARGSLSTGVIRLDLSLSRQGLARGAIVEIEGPPGSGKTSLCQRIVAHAQRSGETCAWFDLDHTLDGAYAARCGVDAQQLYLAEPAGGEQALEIVLALVSSGGLGVMVLDSLTALVSQDEIDTALGERAGLPGRELIAAKLPALAAAVRQSGAVLLLTRGTPERPGVVYRGLSQNPTRLALDLYAGQRLRLSCSSGASHFHQTGGSKVQLKVLKDHVAATARPLDLDIMYNDGISDSADLLDLGLQLLVINEQNGQRIFDGLNLGADATAAQRFIQEHARVADRIRASIRQKIQAYLGQDSS